LAEAMKAIVEHETANLRVPTSSAANERNKPPALGNYISKFVPPDKMGSRSSPSGFFKYRK
jgi:hypothetical protein